MITTRRTIRVVGPALLTLALVACQSAIRPVQSPQADITPVLGTPPVKPANTLRVYFIDVGNGMCHVIQCPGDKRAIIDDCGSTNATLALEPEEAVDRVQDLTKGRALDVVVTHTDLDHSKYLADALAGRAAKDIKTFWAGGSYPKYSAQIQGWIDNAKVAGADVRVNDAPPSSGIEGFPEGWHGSPDGEPVSALQCGAADSYVLTVDSGASSNASSLVLMLSYAGKKIILPGDATAVTEAAAIENFKADIGFLNADVVETSHHGAGSFSTPSSNTTDWAEATLPRMLVSSAGWQLGYRHPRCAALDRYTGVIGPRIIAAVDKHALWCGEDKTQTWKKTNPEKLADYSTASNGEIVVDISSKGTTALYFQVAAKAGAPPSEF